MTLLRYVSLAVMLVLGAPAARAGGDGLLAVGFDEDWSVPGARNLSVEVPGTRLRGRLYLPSANARNGAAVVALHGCTGMWSNGVPGTLAQVAIEKWGQKLSAEGFVVLAVDSYTDRAPPGEDPADYQVQCSYSPLAGFVDPYTERVADFDAAAEWLPYRLGALIHGPVGALGWSQGAQTVLVRAAETDRFSNTSLYDSPWAETRAISAAVAFYPGCGPDLEFRDGPVTTSYWRPHASLRINHGGADPLESNCAIRADNALGSYGAQWLQYVAYEEAAHGFDRFVENWPSSGCGPYDTPDVCAAKEANVASLEFLKTYLLSAQ